MYQLVPLLQVVNDEDVLVARDTGLPAGGGPSTTIAGQRAGLHRTRVLVVVQLPLQVAVPIDDHVALGIIVVVLPRRSTGGGSGG